MARRCIAASGSVLLLAALAGLVGTGASAQTLAPDAGVLPLGNLLEIVELEQEILAVDAQSGGSATVRRRIGERVLWMGTRGLVGIVITDQRVLGVAAGSTSWQEIDYERGESPPPGAALGDRVGLVVLPQRVLGFVGNAGRFVEVRLGPQEDLRATRVGANVAVLVTDREAHGLSPNAGGFTPIRLQLKERVTDVVARSNLATITTSERVLVFRGPAGTWAERRH